MLYVIGCIYPHRWVRCMISMVLCYVVVLGGIDMFCGWYVIYAGVAMRMLGSPCV